jgi:hypothetical protein
VAGVVLAVARALGAGWSLLPDTLRLAALAPEPAAVTLPAGPPGEHLVGVAYEALLPATSRRQGAHYTPIGVARGLASLALSTRDGGESTRVCDPAAGCGAFLLAAAAVLEAAGHARVDVVDRMLWGADVDPAAVAVCEAALALWAGRVRPMPNLVVADALVEGRKAWPGAPDFDVIVGNPPFRAQRATRTARSPERVAALRRRFGDAVRPYADDATLFQLAALDLCRAGGTVLLVQPTSVLAARDAAPARAIAAGAAALEGLWIGGEDVFAAKVAVCAPLLRVGCTVPARVRRWYGAAVEEGEPAPAPAAGGNWASLLGAAEAARRPSVAVVHPSTTLGDRCRATAGFRAEYYALVPAVHELADGVIPRPGDGIAPLVTSGLVDPGRCHWGERDARFARRAYRRPVVDLAAIGPVDGGRVERWVRQRLRPKVVVAGQTRVIEAAVDEHGSWVPSVPLISVEADAADVWRIGAALLAPPMTAWALDRCAGTAMRDDHVKLAAAHVHEVPAPQSTDAWDEGAALVRRVAAAADETEWRAVLADFGAVMAAAYGLAADDPIVAWWHARLPRWHS